MPSAGRHTPLERKVIGLTRELVAAYRQLERVDGVDHPSHGQDVADAVHVVQRIVGDAAREARRAGGVGSWLNIG